MWFEIFYPVTIIVSALTLPAYFYPTIRYLVIGNPCRKSMSNVFERRLYLRDWRVSGNPNVLNGIETIEDEGDDGGDDGGDGGDGSGDIEDTNFEHGAEKIFENKAMLPNTQPDSIRIDIPEANPDNKTDECLILHTENNIGEGFIILSPEDKQKFAEHITGAINSETFTAKSEYIMGNLVSD